MLVLKECSCFVSAYSKLQCFVLRNYALLVMESCIIGDLDFTNMVRTILIYVSLSNVFCSFFFCWSFLRKWLILITVYLKIIYISLKKKRLNSFRNKINVKSNCE